MTASIATYPHEVIRTRFQTEKRPLNGNGGHDPSTERRGLIRMTQHIVTHEGWRALYRGLSVNLVRTVPNSAVTMLTWVPSSPLFYYARGRERVLTVTCPCARFPCLFAGTRCSCARSTVDRAFHDTTSGRPDANMYHGARMASRTAVCGFEGFSRGSTGHDIPTVIRTVAQRSRARHALVHARCRVRPPTHIHHRVEARDASSAHRHGEGSIVSYTTRSFFLIISR